MNNTSFFLIALFLTGALVLYTGYHGYHYEAWSPVVKKEQPKWYPGIDQHSANEIIRLEAESLAAEKKMKQWDEAMHEMLEKNREKQEKRDEELNKNLQELAEEEKKLRKKYSNQERIYIPMDDYSRIRQQQGIKLDEELNSPINRRY